MMHVAVCNNMVTPYTNRLFNRIVQSQTLKISVVSCTDREKDRNWSKSYASEYLHIILKGFSLELGKARFAHFNPGIWHALSRLSPDVVAINGLYPTMLIAALWSAVHRKPLVFLTDGWHSSMPNSPLHRALRPLVFKKASAFICSSAKGRRYFLDQGIESRRIFVAHIVPAWPAPADVPSLDRRPYHLLWCARIDDPRKNAPFFFDLALALKEKIPDLRLRIVADSQTRSHDGLDNLSKAGIEFDYTPFVSPDRISAVFASARMLILPSIHEPWGLVCNEAMQCGTPCAVSPHTGAADDLVVNGASGLVLDLDVERWASAIAAILADRAHWEAMSHAAVATAAKFSLESSANEYIHGLTSSTQDHLSGTKTTIARHTTTNTM